MSNLPALTPPVYATDEDILVKASGDFMTLAPSWQCMAKGTDGVFQSGQPWVLTSASVNFGSNGVAPNQVVCLSGPKSQYPGGGDLLAIDSVSRHNAITLRRPHKDLNVGSPPAPAAGLTGVTFTITTFDPQIAEASFDIKRRFGIDENITFRDSSWIYDLQRPADGRRPVGPLRPVHGRAAVRPRRLGPEDGAYPQSTGRGPRPRSGPLGAVRQRAEPSTVFSCKISR